MSDKTWGENLMNESSNAPIESLMNAPHKKPRPSFELFLKHTLIEQTILIT